MSTQTVETTSIETLDVYNHQANIRRDLHIFVDYVRNRKIKRAHRTNGLPKADSKRLIKLLDVEGGEDELAQHGYCGWVDYIDDLALALGFVSYDMEGVYAGYSSREPSFPDNYIEFNEQPYESFLNASLIAQERTLLDLFMTWTRNEFYQRSALGQLQSFYGWGSGTGVMPTLDFVQIRRYLLKELSELESGVWYSTASWIAHLKQRNPYFLIPKNPEYKRHRNETPTRYGNFHESENEHGYGYNRESIADNEPDGFERVEGRYIERFLENLPLLLLYVDVAYRREPYKGIYPSMGQLSAFRVNEHFLQFMQSELAPPRVLVQPNYEVHIESVLYPSRVLAQLKPLGTVLSDDTIIVIKLDKQKVTQQVAENEALDVVQLLTDLSDRPLPQNIQVELEEWAGQSEKFVLYTGFGLLESSRKRVPEADQFTAEEINDKMRLVRDPNLLYTRLEEAENFPLLMRHHEDKLRLLPKRARTVFRTEQKRKAKPKSKPELPIKRTTTVTLHFADSEMMAIVNRALIAARCPIESDNGRLTLSYDQQNEQMAKAVFKQLAKEYKITFADQ